ncbi:hypothetical protein Sru01_44700 [Sphaerisporangium rufum]|uniref:Uncharacterized protein n=1 Tax=Sphaerisporangium rufum TaxID=1381558 RepID=A0A919R566_9ACTN|nr:hypothetical protein Sru01_44700 [Sphaerisporangium rufum]
MGDRVGVHLADRQDATRPGRTQPPGRYYRPVRPWRNPPAGQKPPSVPDSSAPAAVLWGFRGRG